MITIKPIENNTGSNNNTGENNNTDNNTENNTSQPNDSNTSNPNDNSTNNQTNQQVDSDNDGIVDSADDCPNTISNAVVDDKGCIILQKMNKMTIVAQKLLRPALMITIL